MKPLFRIIGISLLAAVLSITGLSCAQPASDSQEGGRRIALASVKSEATYRFDGISDTLKVTGATSVAGGWQYTVEFDSLHGGYGNRSGQALDTVITHHRAAITVRNGSVTSAVLDNQWDMIHQRIDMEIKLAPIDEVNVTILESNPPQISVYIKGGLPDGCTTFHDIETTREGSTVNITVTVQRPRGVDCPAIYTYFEKYINLGSDFIFGTTYTLNVNDYHTTFDGTLIKGEGFAVYLTAQDIPPQQMEALSHVDIASQPIVSLRDIIAYNAQTHEIELTDAAFEHIAQLEVPVRGRSFVVCVDKVPIYWGAFWTPISSISFDGVTILKPSANQEHKTITLQLGYPSSDFYQGEDPRNNPAAIESLEQAGKLISARYSFIFRSG